MCPVNTKICVEQYRTVKHLSLYFYNKIFWAAYQKSKQRMYSFYYRTCFLNIFLLKKDHRFLERDVKIYINMISVKTAGYNIWCTPLLTCTNISEEVIMSQCNHTRGTNHMFKRMSQLRQEGLRSLNTSSISLVTYSVTHFLSSSFPYFFPCFLCLLLKNCKKRHLKFHPSDALLCIFIGKRGQRKERKGREKVGQSKEGGKNNSRVIEVLIRWDCNGLRSIRTLRPAHCLLTKIKWMMATDCFHPAVTQTGKLKAGFFFKLHNVRRKGHRNNQSIAKPLVMYRYVVKYKAFCGTVVLYKDLFKPSMW